jgi:hypothetical protein
MLAGGLLYDRKFHATAECWSVFEEVLTKEYENAVLFGQIHQLTVDAYAVQHAGGAQPDKSVCIHLVGLHLVLERGIRPTEVPVRFRHLAGRGEFPHLVVPKERAALTVLDVAMADSALAHARRVREWAGAVWNAWRVHHDVARELAAELVGRTAPDSSPRGSASSTSSGSGRTATTFPCSGRRSGIRSPGRPGSTSSTRRVAAPGVSRSEWC